MNPILIGIIGAIAMWYLLALLSWVFDADTMLTLPITFLVYTFCIPSLPFYWAYRLFKNVVIPVERERFIRCKFKHVLNITDRFKLVRESKLTWRFWTWFFFVRIKKSS